MKGSVLHQQPRLLHVDGIEVEAPLERNLVYMRNRDIPGVIGRVGTILGEHKINIADFSLGPESGSRGRGQTARSAGRSARGWRWCRSRCWRNCAKPRAYNRPKPSVCSKAESRL